MVKIAQRWNSRCPKNGSSAPNPTITPQMATPGYATEVDKWYKFAKLPSYQLIILMVSM